MTDRPIPPSALGGPLGARRAVRKAVILAAGRGRRMGELTADRPKAALEVGGHALIDWQITALQRAGVSEIAVVTGHGAAALAGREVEYIHNPGWRSGAQVESLLCAAPWVGGDPVIVSYSDILYHPSAALALLERPGDIVIAYDADHRWLWKRRFGDWLVDSETFRLGPGQALTEIGAQPRDIEEIEGQFMGLMLLSAEGLQVLAERFASHPDPERRRVDFTRLLSSLIGAGVRIDTAVNILPWMEVDRPKDLRIARRMTRPDALDGSPAALVFPADLVVPATPPLNDAGPGHLRPEPLGLERPGEPTVSDAFGVVNWGRSGSTFLQSLFDGHPQILSTPNFYSRPFYKLWASRLCLVGEQDRVAAFVDAFRQWWDSAWVDATAGLHRLGPRQNQIAGVDRRTFEAALRRLLPPEAPITRRSLLVASHLAYAQALGRTLTERRLQLLYPIHGRPRGEACALIEDFPGCRFIHTVREPIANIASALRHVGEARLDGSQDRFEIVLSELLLGKAAGAPGRTTFGDRPYLRYLADRDQARFLRLEDLHADSRAVLAAASDWLGLDFDARLLESTWDGLRWWNRPESGTDSRLGSTDLARNVAATLDQRDLRRIEDLACASSAIGALYPAVARRNPPLRVLTGALRPWRGELTTPIGEVRRLLALRWLCAVLPPVLRRRFAGRRALAIAAARQSAMDHGLVLVRERLAPELRSCQLNALIRVRRSNDGVVARVLLRNRCDLHGPDRLEVTIDREVCRLDLANRIIDGLVATVGLGMARTGAYGRNRWILVQLLGRRLHDDPAPVLRALGARSPAP